MRSKVGSIAALAAAVMATGAMLAPAAAAADDDVSVKYVCTSKNTSTTGYAKCADLAKLDRYRAKVTCIDSRGVKAVFYGPWKSGKSGEWSKRKCPGTQGGAVGVYKAGYQVELF
ncbi:hypothetical protein ACFZCY_11870 [Streptomyces sp. NPDC007983]|uniref:hypothetical protein n=1 Tax=Streptomyces sp. NPDC007983 TaxID=3364800 RepID=UPI0036E92930